MNDLLDEGFDADRWERHQGRPAIAAAATLAARAVNAVLDALWAGFFPVSR